MQNGEIGCRRIAGGLLGELNRCLKALAVLDQILRDAGLMAFLGAERPAGQHHVLHPRHANQARDPTEPPPPRKMPRCPSGRP